VPARRIPRPPRLLSSKGASFVKEAAAGNQSEIALAQLAQQKAQNPEIKSLAQLIQQDHQQAQEKLQKPSRWPTASRSTRIRAGASVARKQTGGNWPARISTSNYAKDMLEDHVTDIKKIPEKASEAVEDSDVKQYAAETLPRLQAHLQHAEAACQIRGR